MLINLIKDEKPSHIAVAFDVSRKTFRTQLFPEYKANRTSTPDEFRSQITLVNEMIDCFGIKHFEMDGYEADDIIATFAKSAEKNGYKVLICTGDRDSFQLVNSNTTVLYPKKGVTELSRMTPEAVFEKYGLTPAQYPDFAALRGDSSDNLPSVPGVGEKTAIKWITDYGNLDKLLANAKDITGKVGDSLRANIETIKLNRELTHLQDNLDLKVQIDQLDWSGFDSNLMAKFFEKMEIRVLKERLKSLPQVGGAVPKDRSIKVSEVSADQMSSLLEKQTTPIAIAFDYQDKSFLGYAVATSENEVFYVKDSKMGDWVSKPQPAKYVHSAKFALKNLQLSGVASDIEILAYLCNPGSRNLSLSDLAERILGEVTNPEDLFSQFDPKQAAWIFIMQRVLISELKSKGMDRLYKDLEQPTLLLLSKMEEIGIAVDQEKLNQLSSHFTKIVADETLMAYKEAGHEFNVSSPKQLQVVLFDELKLPKTKKIKTGFTTDAESLEWLAGKTKHPLLKHLLRIRESSKLMTTIDGLITAVANDGRIHTNFQQIVAATGRLSSTDPNLQNIPIRTEDGRKIRDCFVAQEPYLGLLTADYSQIEMRIMAHLSNDKGLIAAFESGEDLHSTVASLVFNVKKNVVDAEMRRTIKAMSYGLAYGLSSFGLSQQLDIDPASASELMGKYFERFGGIRDYLKTVVEQARELGYTQTILGRRRYLPDLNHENRQRREIAERAALNAPIQGSAADIIKIAMLKVESKIKSENLKSRLLLQVHDELIFEVSPGEQEKLSKVVKEQMSNAYTLNVPLDVNIGVGKSWDLAAH
jgi:DNA polymerase-1